MNRADHEREMARAIAEKRAPAWRTVDWLWDGSPGTTVVKRGQKTKAWWRRQFDQLEAEVGHQLRYKSTWENEQDEKATAAERLQAAMGHVATAALHHMSDLLKETGLDYDARTTARRRLREAMEVLRLEGDLTWPRAKYLVDTVVKEEVELYGSKDRGGAEGYGYQVDEG